MASELRDLVQTVMDNPGKIYMLYFADRQSMEAKRTRLLQLRRSIRDMGDVENIRVKSETLEKVTSSGYSYRVTIQYLETSPSTIVVLNEDGSIEPYIPVKVDISDDVPESNSSDRINAVEDKVRRLIMEKNLGTAEEVLAHFETFIHKPSKELMNKYFSERDRAMNRIKTGSREKMSGDFKAMKESGFGRDKAIEVYPKAPEDLLDEYFPK